MSRRADQPDDSGTILVLLLGFVAVLLLMVAVVVNVSSVILAKRGLVSAADGAALSAAQSLDLEALYAGGLPSNGIPLDGGLRCGARRAYEAVAAPGQPGLQLVLGPHRRRHDRRRAGRTRGGAAVRAGLGFEPVRVEAEAGARAPVLP
jgi:hypothetical protein